jgi:hypothetical protein
MQTLCYGAWKKISCYIYVSPSNEGRHIVLVWFFLPLLLLLLSEACPDHNFFVFPDRKQMKTRKNCFRYLKLMSPLNAAICTTISYTLRVEWYYGRHIVLVWFFLPLLLLLLSEACPDHNFFVFPDRSMIFGMWVHDHKAVCCTP